MFAYVVMSHSQPEVLSRLAHRIRTLSPNAAIVLRHDARSCALPDDLPDGCHLRASTTPIAWGDWSIVAVMLEEIRYVRTHTDATHVAFISGLDYPARPLQEWEREVSSLDAVLTAQRLDFRPRWGRHRGYEGDETAIRFRYRWFRVPGTGGWNATSRAGRLANRLTFRLISNVRPALYYRLLPRGRGLFIGVRRRWSGPPVYKGWQWLMLSARAMDVALESQLVPKFKHTLIPDESYLHTIVCNDPSLTIRHAAVSYTRWDASLGTPHPATLQLADVDGIVASGAPFARKIETRAVQDALDEHNR